MKMNQLLTVGVVAGMCLGASNLLAQTNNNSNGRQGRPGPGGPPDAARIAQWQQERMDRYKTQLEITDDAEWKAIQPLVQKVRDARQAAAIDLARGMFGGRPGRGGDNQPGDQNRPRGGFGGAPNPEADALQKAIDSKASGTEMKAAVTKYQESRKAKIADLEKAQAALRAVLSVRQEAIATLNGLL